MMTVIEDLVDEVRLTFHACSAFARCADGDEVDPSGRAVLEYLHRRQPSTVPDIARARGVTRQHVQTIVNALRAAGLVQTQANPAHRRSPLIALTTPGAELIVRITRREGDLLASAFDGLDPDRCRDAVAVLTEVRHRVETATQGVAR